MLKRIYYVIAAFIIACGVVTTQSTPTRAVIPTNRPIVYVNGLDGHIVSINPDGSNRRDYGAGFFPQLSPDGRKIAFSRYADDFLTRDLYVINTDGSQLRKIATRVHTPGSSVYSFSWSPNSKKLAFTKESGKNDPQTGGEFKQISTVNATGGAVQQLTYDGAGIYNANPVWSPDGMHILYQHTTGLYIMNSNGNSQRLVVAEASQGSWSPDGNKILFLHTDLGIQIANIDSSHRVSLSPIGNNARWSPDGKKIVMEAPNCGCSTEPAAIIIFNADGSGKTVIATPPSAGALQHPVWSPSSNAVAFVEFATWQPARLVTKPITGGDASVVIIERVGYPEWAYTRSYLAQPHFPLPRDIVAGLYQWLSNLGSKLRLF